MKPEVPNTSVLVRLAPSSAYGFAPLHAGQPAFLGVGGVKIGSYQLLNPEGKAIASCTICDELIEETFAAGFVDISSFHEAVKAHFATAVPIDFSKESAAA